MEESTSYTAIDVAGNEVEIVSKYGEGDRIILVTADGAKYVSAGQDKDWIEPYDPEKHLGGDSTGMEPNPNADGGMSNELDGVDATEYANAEAEAKAEAMGVTTNTAEAVEAQNNVSPAEPYVEDPPAGDPDAVDPEPTAIPPGEEDKSPPAADPEDGATDLATEQPEGSGKKDGPPSEDGDSGKPEPGAGDELTL